MKLRITEDGVRLRLGRGDVQRLRHEGTLGAMLSLGRGSFAWRVECATDVAAAEASFEADGLLVRLPADAVALWAGDDAAITLEAEVDGRRVLVEKDLACTTPGPDCDAPDDAFPRPD